MNRLRWTADQDQQLGELVAASWTNPEMSEGSAMVRRASGPSSAALRST